MVTNRIICNKCAVEKPITDFPAHKNRLYGVSKICKTCMSKYPSQQRQPRRMQMLTLEQIRENIKKYNETKTK